MVARGNFGPGTKTLRRQRRKIKASSSAASTPPHHPASFTLFRKWMFLQPRSQPSNRLPQCYTRLIIIVVILVATQTTLSIALPLSNISAVGVSLLARSSVRPSCHAQKRESDPLSLSTRHSHAHLARSPLCVLTIFQIPKAALPTKWLFRGRPLFRSSFVASSRQ